MIRKTKLKMKEYNRRLDFKRRENGGKFYAALGKEWTSLFLINLLQFSSSFSGWVGGVVFERIIRLVSIICSSHLNLQKIKVNK